MTAREERCHTRQAREAGEWRHHAVHRKVLQVEASWRALLRLAIGRREVAIRVCVCPRRRDVGWIEDICIDQFELLVLAESLRCHK